MDMNKWMTRSLGEKEREFLFYSGPHWRSTMCVMARISPKNGHVIDEHLFQKSVAALVYCQPQLRCCVDLTVEPPAWVPATDFSPVFSHVDLGTGGMEEVWDMVEDQVNQPWDSRRSAPLYRCTLVKTRDLGYFVLNCYQHAVADGRSGMVMLEEILEQYNRLEEGGEVERKEREVMEPVEEYIRVEVKQAGALEKMVEVTRSRTKNPSAVLGYDDQELAENGRLEMPINKTLWREGKVENYEMIRAKCKQEQVNINNALK